MGHSTQSQASKTLGNDAGYYEGVQKRIMVVDDEPSILKSIKRSLAHSHYRIDTFSEPNQALTSAHHNAYDLVISDQRMPCMSGIELLTHLKCLQPECVTILLTGYSDNSTLLDAINKAHVYRFLTKPWHDEELVQLIADAIDYGEEQALTQRLADQARVNNGSMTRHRAYMRELEARYPGITRIERDENGAIVLTKYKQNGDAE